MVLAQDLLRANSHLASGNREILDRHGVRALNIIGSPGAGKTALLERTVEALKGRVRLGVIEGDISTTRDAERIAKTGAQVVQVNTGGNCHLNAGMVGQALEKLPLEKIDLLVIENVGNLVCPAAFDLGEDLKAVVLSVAEGDDKPEKYPATFLACGAAVITKTDLLGHTDFDLKRCVEEIRAVNGNIIIFSTSSRTGEGFDEWCAWLEDFALKGRMGRGE